ncbi:nitrite reductase small subunit NirD [Calidithermus roseus]|uniref:Nitrite reductase (NADH) small subunit n=1 Tax=Calidithermus roseus TaxID=1644118 RepID=A0A399EIG9_9DEIN|nr:nitrite reductase small subunit NirD [Calidithermus roseus]RIH83758.1 Nitrite reductase (NADH) small subunit [Calidithermus roseus]
MNWVRVCRLEDILPGSGVCALVEGRQVAIFRVGERLFALSNFDPFTQANVLSRGLVGSKGERLYVASPLLKHRFDLESGEYLDDPSIRLPVYAVRLEAGEVWVGVPISEAAKVGT